MQQAYKPKKFAKMIGVSIKTLQRWDIEGRLPAYRTPTNRRFYTHEQYENYLAYGNKTQMKNITDLHILGIVIEDTKDFTPDMLAEFEKRGITIFHNTEEAKAWCAENNAQLGAEDTEEYCVCKLELVEKGRVQKTTTKNAE